MHRYEVPDMSCGHCAATIERAVKSVDPQAVVTVDLTRREIAIETSAPDADITSAMRSAGYDSRPVAA